MSDKTGMIGILLAGLCMVGCQSDGAAEAARWRGKPIPKLSVTDWVNTDAVGYALQDLKGKVVVVEFWATWCGPCVRAIPHMNELDKQHKSDGLVILAIHAPPGAEKSPVKRFAKKHKMTYAIGLDPKSETTDDWGVDAFPTAFVIDRAGEIVWVGHPADDGFDRAIKAALAAK